MKVPEAGTEVFNPHYGTLGSPITTNFPVDLSISNKSTGSSYSHFYTFTRLMGQKYLRMAAQDAEADGGSASPAFDVMNSIDLSGWYGASSTASAWSFKRAPKFMDVVGYTTTVSSSGQTDVVTHNLTVAPEMIIVKNRTGSNIWMVYHKDVGINKYLQLSTTGAEASGTWSFPALPTATQFTTGWAYPIVPVISYLFATLAGVSKVGSYSGTGSAINVDCGFSNGARFILIKRADSTGEWYFFDTANGIVSGSDNYWDCPTGDRLTQDTIDPLSSGFTVTSSAPADINASGGTYIFLAIA